MTVTKVEKIANIEEIFKNRAIKSFLDIIEDKKAVKKRANRNLTRIISKSF